MPEDRESAGRWFKGFARDELIAAYDMLRAVGGVPKEDAEAFLGSAEMVQELTDRGMAHVVPHTRTAPATFQAIPPDLVMMALLADYLGKTAADHELILDGYRRLAAMQTKAQSASCAEPDERFRILTDREEILKRSLDLSNSPRKDWMTFETLDSDMPVTEDYRSSIPPSLRAQVRVRSIYDFASTQHKVASLNMLRGVEDGDEARWLQELPLKMLLADETVAMLPFDITGTGGALIVRAVPILRMLRDYFEIKWRIAIPVGCAQPPADCPLNEKQYEMLRMLAKGLPDKTIASNLGVGESTVYRRIEAILKVLGTDSRFVAGLRAQQLGWLEAKGRRNG